MASPPRPFLAPAAPEPESRDYLARTLPVLLWASLAGCLASAALALLNSQTRTAAALLAGAVPLVASFALARRGWLRLASAVALGDGLVLVTCLLWVGEGLRDVGLLAYPVILIVGGMLLEGPAFGVLFGLCLASAALVTHGQRAGWVPSSLPSVSSVGYSDLAYVAIVLAVAAAVVRLLANGLKRSLRDAEATERALRASEETFYKAFRSNPVIMVITALEDAQILDVNDAFTAATGYRREEAVGRWAVDLGVWLDDRERQAVADAVLAGDSVRGFLARFRRRSGEVGSGLLSAEVIDLAGRRCVLYAVADITARQQAEDALAASEERYRLISEVISDYTFSTRVGPDGRLRLDWVAGAFERITGYTFEEYVARGGWPAALHPDDVEQDARDLREIHARRSVVTEVRTITRSGAVRWVRIYAHPVWNDSENRLAGIFGAVQDVTERRQAAAEREALVRELEAKNAELERFAYTVSHDLKSPLITVRSFLGFLEEDARTGNFERLRGDVARIVAATDRMQRLLKELLDLSRVGHVASPPVELPFAELAREAVALVRGRVEGRGVRVVIGEDLPPVWGDRTRLVEVLQNLLDNAVKFMGEERQPLVEIGSRSGDGRTVFYVRDNGIGIEPRHHQKVFGLFEKLDPRSEGTGVGLALVKRIVETHGGTIWVESEGPGHGSAFCFTLGGRPG